MPADRRKSDLAIIEKLGEIHTNLALNTQSTQQNTAELVKLNGKVVAHESRLQSAEAANALIAANLAQLQAAMNEKNKEKRDWIDWGLKALIALGAMMFYYLLQHAGFPNFLN